jgi:hypothetical protein
LSPTVRLKGKGVILIALSLLIILRKIDLRLTIGNRDDIRWFVNAALQLAFVTARVRIWICGVENRIVTCFAVGGVGAV